MPTPSPSGADFDFQTGDGGGVRLLADGPWEAGQVRVEERLAAPVFAPSLEAELERRWAIGLAEAAAAGRRLFDAPLVGLAELAVGPEGLRLTASRTWFRHHWAAHVAAAQGRFPKLDGVPSGVAGIGVSALVVTADGRWVMPVRSAVVAYHAGAIHPFAGLVEPADVAGGAAGLFGAPVRELCEEAAVRPSDVAGVRLLAVIREIALDQPELMFEVRLSVPAAALAGGAKDGWESAGLWAGDESSPPDARMTPVARAALALLRWHGRPPAAPSPTG